MTMSFDGLPVQLYVNAVIDTDELGSPRVSGANARTLKIEQLPPGITTIDVAFRDHIMISHYFHFIELLLTAFATLNEVLPHSAIGRVYVGKQAWNDTQQEGVQSQLIRHVLSPGRIVDDALLGFDGNNTSDLLLVVDRFAPITNHFNKFLEPILPLCMHHAIKMQRRVLDGLGIPVRDQAAKLVTRALYIQQDPPLTLTSVAERTLRDLFDQNGIRFDTIDFATLSWEEQVAAAHGADWLVGQHGNGLTNIVWMPRRGRVLEIFPEDSHHYDYQFLAEIFRHRYYGIEGKQEPSFVYTTGSRLGPSYGLIDKPTSVLPNWLGSIISEMA